MHHSLLFLFSKPCILFLERNYRVVTTIFIITSLLIFLWLGNPVRLLILAGAVNGIILPLALSVVLVAALKKKIVGDYQHPLWMQIAGWLVVALMSWMGWLTITNSLSRLSW